MKNNENNEKFWETLHTLKTNFEIFIFFTVHEQAAAFDIFLTDKVLKLYGVITIVASSSISFIVVKIQKFKEHFSLLQRKLKIWTMH